ncbi:MAG: tetratricopeptide repeat protein [Gammaproteobacteria bacterium]|nr:tetratricopeptide repeat protein [Gammaproteobacteria bacterium]
MPRTYIHNARLLMAILISPVFSLVLSGCASTVPVPMTIASAPYYLDQPRIRPAQINPSTEDQAIAHFLMGEVAVRNEDWPVAMQHLTAAADLIDDAVLAERVVHIGVYAKDNAHAYQASQRWVALAPDNVEAWQFNAMLALRVNDLPQARTAMRAILALTDDAKGFMSVATLLAIESDATLALQRMAELIVDYRSNPHALFAYASLAAIFQRYEAALHLSKAALTLKPDLSAALILQARLLRQLDQTEAALALLEKALLTQPKDFELRSAYALLLMSSKRYPQASEQYQLLLQQAPNDGDLLLSDALLAMDMGRTVVAEKQLRKMLALNQRSDEAHYFLGRLAEGSGSDAAAITAYQAVSEESKYVLEARLRMLHAMARVGKINDALILIQQWRANEITDAFRIRFWLTEAQLFREAKKTEEAFAALTTALKEYPDNGDILYNRALIAETLGQPLVAEADLRAVLKKEPENASAMNALGYLLANHTTRYQEAFMLVDKALKLKPDDAAITDSLGWVLYRMGKYREAAIFLKRALILQYDTEIAAHLGEVLWVAGEHQAAEMIWRKALEQTPNDTHVRDTMRQFNVPF